MIDWIFEFGLAKCLRIRNGSSHVAQRQKDAYHSKHAMHKIWYSIMQDQSSMHIYILLGKDWMRCGYPDEMNSTTIDACVDDDRNAYVKMIDNMDYGWAGRFGVSQTMY